MNKIEEVAEAIYEARNGFGCRPWSRQGAEYKRPYIADAKAAISAMRVTTGDMRTAGAEAARRHTSYFDNPTAQIVYETMIDTALKEETGK